MPMHIQGGQGPVHKASWDGPCTLDAIHKMYSAYYQRAGMGGEFWNNAVNIEQIS